MKGVLPRDQLSRDQLPLNQLPIDQLHTRSTHGKLIYCCPATEYDRSFYHVIEYISFISTILVMGTTSYGRWFTHNLLPEGKMEAAVQWTFYLTFFLSFSTKRKDSMYLPCLHFTHSCTKCRPRLLPSESEATTHETVYMQKLTYTQSR